MTVQYVMFYKTILKEENHKPTTVDLGRIETWNQSMALYELGRYEDANAEICPS